MAEEVALRLTVDAVNAVQSVGELKKMISDAKSEALKFGEGTKGFQQFADVAAVAQSRLTNLNKEIRLANPNELGRSFMAMGNTVVGGFTAMQGAAAMFGGSTKDIEQSLLKVQSAMAILQGFQAIQEGTKAFGALRLVVLSVTQGMSAMKVAIASTGIGALVVAIGALVYVMNEEADAATAAAEAQKKHAEAMKEAANWAEFLSSVTADSAKNQLALAKARGASLEELQQLEKDYVNTQLKGLAEVYAATTDVDKRDQLLIQKRDLQNQLLIIDADYRRQISDRDKANLEKAKQAFEERKKLDAAEMKYISGRDAGLIKQEKDTDTAITKTKTENWRKQLDELIKNSGSQLAYLMQDAEQRKQLESGVVFTLAALGNITIQNHAKQAQFQKKVAAINIIVSQAEAIAQAVKGAAGIQFPFNIGAIATSVGAILTIFAEVKSLFSKSGNIGGTPTLDTGGGGFGGGSIPSGVNLLQQPSTKLDDNNSSSSSSPVVIQNNVNISESDIRKVQDKVNKISAQALIG